MKQNVASNRPLWVGLLCGERSSQRSACGCASHSEGGIDRPAGTAIAAATGSGLQSVQRARIDRGSAPLLVTAGLVLTTSREAADQAPRSPFEADLRGAEARGLSYYP